MLLVKETFPSTWSSCRGRAQEFFERRVTYVQRNGGIEGLFYIYFSKHGVTFKRGSRFNFLLAE